MVDINGAAHFSFSSQGIQDYTFETCQSATCKGMTSVLGTNAHANNSVDVTCFNYDTGTKTGKKALWMLKNLLRSMEPSL